jgi:peptidoglycan hydrolase-like protein with peptidoglycan-binding domain
LPAAVGLTLVGLLVSGCSTGAAKGVAADRPAVVDTPAGSPSTDATDEPATEASDSPSPSPTASRSPRPTRPPAPTYDVKAVQTQLTSLGYYASAIDGERGPARRSAVMAFQKVQGMRADGVVGKTTLAALKAPRKPVLRASAPTNRVEVDLSKQVLYVVKGGAIARILPVSSGNGRSYLQKNGHRAKALTPVGWYKVERRIVGVREADLGSLYDPQYFYRGWAIHGSNSVPAYPASHGCIRVTRTDAKYLLRAISVGTSVFVYGGTYTFTAGSSAPGTDNPTGDTAGDTSPTPTPTASASAPASSSPSASPSPSPSATASPTPSRSGPPIP